MILTFGEVRFGRVLLVDVGMHLGHSLKADVFSKSWRKVIVRSNVKVLAVVGVIF